MTDGFEWVRAALRDFPNLPEQPDASLWPRPQRRLMDALVLAARPDAPARHRDIVPLTRQVLLGAAPGPFTDPLPVAQTIASPGHWRSGGFDCAEADWALMVRVREWAPA